MYVIATEERDRVSGRSLDEIWEITADEWRSRRGSQRRDAAQHRLGTVAPMACAIMSQVARGSAPT